MTWITRLLWLGFLLFSLLTFAVGAVTIGLPNSPGGALVLWAFGSLLALSFAAYRRPLAKVSAIGFSVALLLVVSRAAPEFDVGRPSVRTADEFLARLERGDFDQAYELCRQELSRAEFQALVHANGLDRIEAFSLESSHDVHRLTTWTRYQLSVRSDGPGGVVEHREIELWAVARAWTSPSLVSLSVNDQETDL